YGLLHTNRPYGPDSVRDYVFLLDLFRELDRVTATDSVLSRGASCYFEKCPKCKTPHRGLTRRLAAASGGGAFCEPDLISNFSNAIGSSRRRIPIEAVSFVRRCAGQLLHLTLPEH